MRDIIINYMKNQRFQNKLPEDLKALTVIDVFTSQMTTAFLESYKENSILIVNVAANTTKCYQELDSTVNSNAKWHLKSKFNYWLVFSID